MRDINMSDIENDKLSYGLKTYSFTYSGRVTACVDVIAKSQEDALIYDVGINTYIPANLDFIC